MNDKLIITLAVILCLFILVRTAIENKSKRHYYDSMLREKNLEIERLADDNRRYRDIYLKNAGLKQEDIDKISAVKEVKKS